MVYVVKGGDTLWRIADRELGDAKLWGELAKANQIKRPERLILGQKLFIPEGMKRRTNPPVMHSMSTRPGQRSLFYEHQTPLLPIWAHFFVIADELNPFTRKLVRRIATPEGLPSDVVERIMRPDKYGMTGRVPGSPVNLGLHLKGRSPDSRFISTSENRPGGAERFEGERFWIDTDKAEAAGVKLHEAPAIGKALDKLSAKTKSVAQKEKIEWIREQSLVRDREVVLEPETSVPAAAIKGLAAQRITRGLQVLHGVGLVISAYDIEKAAEESYQQKSVVPLASESVKQSAGWVAGKGGQVAGRAALTWGARWLAAEEGAEIGGIGGAALGIETGPGALISGAVGGLIFGTAAFFGADWATKKLFGSK